jgi:hypothetical protein
MTITFKVSSQTGTHLKEAATRMRVSTSKYVRDLVESDLRRRKKKPFKSAYDVMMELGVVGCFEGPGDLSTNPKYMEGYGEDNRHRRRPARRAA